MNGRGTDFENYERNDQIPDLDRIAEERFLARQGRDMEKEGEQDDSYLELIEKGIY